MNEGISSIGRNIHVTQYIAIVVSIGLFLFIFYLVNGSFTPYKSAGFIGLGFIIFGMLIFLVALIAEMINRLRQSRDRLMVELKRQRFK